jgi:hypothetical protein
MNGYSDPGNDVLMHTLKEIHQSNSTLVFLGDSVMGQTYESFFAEVLRLDPSARKLRRSEYAALESFYDDVLDGGGEYDRLYFRRRYIAVFWVRAVYVMAVVSRIRLLMDIGTHQCLL